MAGNGQSKLDAKRVKLITDALRDGKSRGEAARLAAIGRRTLYDWLAKGKTQTPEGVDAYADDEYGNLVQEVEHAEAEWEQTLLDQIRDAASGAHTNRFGERQHSWQAAAWILERRWPERYAKRDPLKVELTGAGGQPVEIAQQSPEAQDAARQFLRHASGS